MRKTLLLLTLLNLIGCATSTPVDNFCLIYRPVFVDPKLDTPETVRQVTLNNISYEALHCEQTRPRSP